nr:hypothetical protein [Pyrinomonadaceae bacterium]
MNRLFAGLFIVLTACTIQGQTTQTTEPEAKCTLTKAPELRGFRLGMSFSELKARFPELRASAPDEFGYISQASLEVGSLTGASKTLLDGVYSVRFNFLDERLT